MSNLIQFLIDHAEIIIIAIIIYLILKFYNWHEDIKLKEQIIENQKKLIDILERKNNL